jgi:hypothetical protein
MSVRATLAELIARERLLINDLPGSEQTFSDQQIQDQLDSRRNDVRYMELRFAETISPGGAVKWTHYEAERGYWEDSVVIVDNSWTAVTPNTQDLTRGLWVFTAGKTPPLFLTGSHFDIYGSAADLLELRLAQLSEDFDFATDGTSASKSQKREGIATLIQRYRAQQFSIEIPMVRRDMTSSGTGGQYKARNETDF